MVRQLKRAIRRLSLGVNIDHVAALRQARGTNYPDLVEAARAALAAGADGITVHLREDRRHIQDADLPALRAVPGLRLNLEMANDPGVLAAALRERPDEVCLVPERRQERTTECGLDAASDLEALRPTVARLREAGIVVSLFVDPSIRQLEAAALLGAPCVELHTGRFCDAAGADAARELDALQAAARAAHDRGIRVNAGHGIHLGNVASILEIPFLDTLNIGHSIVSRAVFVGLARAVREMKRALRAYAGGEG